MLYEIGADNIIVSKQNQHCSCH